MNESYINSLHSGILRKKDIRMVYKDTWMKELNMRDWKTQVALQCAPVMRGMKISNMLVINRCDIKKILDLFYKTEINVFVLYQTKDKITCYLYRKDNVIVLLHSKEVLSFLNVIGYHTNKLTYVLKECSKRFLRYMKKQGEFPHELGILLGYPLYDVIGFMKNKGKDFLYLGYWKVYANIEYAIEIFHQYDCAKDYILESLIHGENLRTLIKT